MLRHYFFLLLALLLAATAAAADVDPVLDTAERYARLQTQGLPGEVKITVGKLDVERLPPCTAHEAYAPPGTRFSGRTHIGVRCLGPNVWSVLVPVQIAVTGNYVVTARPLVSGQTIREDDLSVVSGDVSRLPGGVVGSTAEAVGKTLRNSLAAGQPLRADQLLAPLVIRQGQSVRVISRGEGFAVSGEGRALNNASAGQLVQVRMGSGGQTINGVAQNDGTVEVGF
ncbi:MAG: flagellar basal body P-ring formation protein FlgA [Azonexus sp.]|nr:flagellar basal body P-ring formation protein FlgA [Azonexus sp.]